MPQPAFAAGLNGRGTFCRLGAAVCGHTFMHCHLPFGGAAFLARQLRQGSSVLGAGNRCAAVCNLRRRCCGRQCGACADWRLCAVHYFCRFAVHGGGWHPHPQQLYRHAAYQHLLFGAGRSACQHYGHNGRGNALNPSAYCG